jgi:hypothetical protein
MTVNELVTLLDPKEVNKCAMAHNIDPLALRSQTLLHLPRLMPGDSKTEMYRIATLLQARTKKHTHYLKPPRNEIKLESLHFVQLDEAVARIFHEAFHYVGSFRPGYHYALQDPVSDKIVCMGSVAYCDLKHVLSKIKDHVPPKEAMAFTRFFAFRWAPTNAFSHFTKRLCSRLAEYFDTTILFTFINPNLGFNGGSHIGAGFRPFALEEGTNYMYFNGQYCTMRHLVNTHGTSDPEKLRAILGSSFMVVDMNLLPMEILAKPLHRRATQVIPATPYNFKRPIITES